MNLSRVRFLMLWVALLVSFLPAACSASTEDNPPDDPTAAATTGAPGSDVPAASPFTPAEPELVMGPLQVVVHHPQDGAVLAEPQTAVSGEASPGTVLTINDEILYLEEGGEFSVTLILEEGPNVIEIVASDNLGNEVFTILSVFYDPEGEMP